MNVFNIRIGLGKVLLIFSNEVDRVGIGISGIDWFTNLRNINRREGAIFVENKS